MVSSATGRSAMPDTADIDRYVEALIDAEPDGVIASYRRKFTLPAGEAVTAAMIRDHWRIERRGTLAILASDAARRAQVAAEAYATVFGQCPWLDRFDGSDRAPDLAF